MNKTAIIELGYRTRGDPRARVDWSFERVLEGNQGQALEV